VGFGPLLFVFCDLKLNTRSCSYCMWTYAKQYGRQRMCSK